MVALPGCLECSAGQTCGLDVSTSVESRDQVVRDTVRKTEVEIEDERETQRGRDKPL